MSIEILDRVALRALDPALLGGLSQAQRDVLAEAIVAALQGACPLPDEPVRDSAVYLRAPTVQE